MSNVIGGVVAIVAEIGDGRTGSVLAAPCAGRAMTSRWAYPTVPDIAPDDVGPKCTRTAATDGPALAA
jgi:hypothetical protein